MKADSNNEQSVYSSTNWETPERCLYIEIKQRFDEHLMELKKETKRREKIKLLLLFSPFPESLF